MRFSQLLTTAAIAATIASTATAQCFQFANTPPGAQFAIADDAVRTVVLPFAFPFHGTTYDRITICSNGFVWFGTGPVTGASDLSDSTAEMLSQPARVAVCWDDWDTDNLAVIPPGGGVFYSADASQCSIVWKGIPRFGSTTVFANMECVLTASGGIHLYFDPTMGVSTSTSITGVSRGPGAVASVVNWSPTLPASISDSTAYESFTINTGAQPFDLAGTTLNFVPNVAPNTTPPIAYTPNNTALPGCAPGSYFAMAVAPVSSGGGCPTPNASIYEFFTIGTGANPFDLANTNLRFVRVGDTYTAIPGGSFDANYATTGTLEAAADDDVVLPYTLGGTFNFGSTAVTSVSLSSNGYIWLGSSTLQQFNSSVATMHSATLPRIAGFWKDLVPNNTTAPIYIENTATKFQATWENVPLFTGAGLHTFQITMDLATGDISINFLAMTGTITTSAPLVGIAPATATNLANSNLATATVPNVIGPVRVSGGGTPLTHTVAGIGAQIGQSLTMNFAGAPASNLGFGVVIVGSQTFNIDLDSLFGPGQAPGCFVYTDALSQFPLAFTAGAATGGLTVPVPFDVFMTGVTLRSQVAILAPVNPL
ncbi:MAG: hypothetical protein ABL997_04735, partial [Planctomycetota bacterium]